jgi:hypothetical protein
MMSIDVAADNDAEAREAARKLLTLMSSPVVAMAVQGEGIKVAPNSKAIVYAPQRDPGPA